MQIYVLNFPEKDGGWKLKFCSLNRKSLESYAAQNGYNNYELDTRGFNFSIKDVDIIYSVNTNMKNPKVFIDYGKYFKTYREALAEEKKLNTPTSTYKYLTEKVMVIK